MAQLQNLFADGNAYERLMGRWSRLAGAQFLDWLDAPANLKWIDVGCGNGAFTEVLIARAAPLAVAGIDPSEGQIAFARTRPGTRLAEFRVGDAQALPFPDNSFDAASMALVLVFVADPVKAAAEMARVVRPGGLVATYMWEFPNGFPRAHRPRDEVVRYGCAGAAECATIWARCHARHLATRRCDVGRDRGDPHPRRFCRLLGVEHRAGRTVRQGARRAYAG